MADPEPVLQGPAPVPESTPGFAELLLPRLPAAYAAALHLTRDPHDAEDLVQEAALRALRAFHTFRPGTNFRAWFVTILTNLYISAYRGRRREGSAVPLEDAPPLHLFRRSAAAGLPTDGPDPARAVIGRLEADRVAEALRGLPDEYREAATLYFVEDLRYQDIAEALEVPVGTVRSRLHRARRVLQARLWEMAVDHGLAPPAPAEEERA